MADKKRILILGGGYAGVWAGKILEKKYRKRDDVEITLVDKKPFHTLMTELHEVAGWRVEPESVQVPFRKIFGARKIDIRVDTITGVDFHAKVAKSSSAEYPFDYIVIGVGAEPEYFGIPGVQENSFPLWSFDDAIRLRHHVEHMFAKAACETDPAKRRRMLTFVVAGAGFTGIEMIGELLEYRQDMCRKHHLDPKETRVVNIEALPSILPILEEPLRVRAENYMKKMGCEIFLNSAITGAEPGKVLLKDGTVVETDTFIWTCGVKGSSFTSVLDVPKAERGRGRMQANDFMQSTAYPYVYLAGDSAFILEPNGKPMPQIVEASHCSAETVAHNIMADIDGGEHHKFKPNYHGFMVSIGGKYGVANAGGMKTRGFMAMAMKHMINCWYLLNIAGINQVWEYLKHEFLDMTTGRTFIGGFVSHRVRAYWPLLLRMWLGLMWVMEGVNKIGEGWLKFDLGSKSGWMFSSGVVQKGVADAASAASGEWAADATAAASGAVEAAAEAVTAASGEWAADATAAASGAAEAVAEGAGKALGKVWDLAKPIFDFNGPVSTWFRTTFMDGMFAHLHFAAFQGMIVVMEILIGLALFGGCFTWLAAVASIGMCVVFTLSGMFAWDQLWFVFAAILCMGGVGRAFGMDYWVVPFFKRWWNGTKFARKNYFYADDPTK
ncbi:MAG TPA: NAD(P)/FAD-dependent oxidoreductase [Spirochaetia bacterium]|nr:NAD(P)/FAD-dependent oxidoreductase [Spirochaetales bacterium]HRY78832.1 NAD(P)/FAD-dependent oxidoreductase [Spirochaetia bacterium]